MKNLPVYIHIRFAEINDKLIGFVESCGRFSDSQIVKSWIKKNCPSAKIADSDNFLNHMR